MKERRMYMRPKGRGFRVLWILLAMTAVPLLAAAWVAWGPGPAGDPGSAAFIGGSRYWRMLMADPAYQRLLALSALRVSVAAAGFPLSFGLRRGLRAASPRLRWGLPVGLMVLGAALSVWMAAAVRSAGVAASAQALWGAAAGGLLLVLGVSALILTMSESRPLQRPRLGTGLVILAALAATLLAFWAGEGWMPGHRSIEPLASAVTVGVEICIRLMLLLLFWVLLTPARPPEAEDGGWPFPPR